MVNKMTILTPIENMSKSALKNVIQKASKEAGVVPKAQKVGLNHLDKDEYVSLVKREHPEIKTIGELYKYLRKCLAAARS